MSIRPVKQMSLSQTTMEGAGVKLNRAFGFGDPSLADPIVMNTQEELVQAVNELRNGTVHQGG